MAPGKRRAKLCSFLHSDVLSEFEHPAGQRRLLLHEAHVPEIGEFLDERVLRQVLHEEAIVRARQDPLVLPPHEEDPDDDECVDGRRSCCRHRSDSDS